MSWMGRREGMSGEQTEEDRQERVNQSQIIFCVWSFSFFADSSYLDYSVTLNENRTN